MGSVGSRLGWRNLLVREIAGLATKDRNDEWRRRGELTRKGTERRGLGFFFFFLGFELIWEGMGGRAVRLFLFQN